VAWITVKRSDFALIAGDAARYRSSTPVVRTFCGKCGTPLTYAHEAAPDDIDVTTVSLDDPAEFPPRDHTWTSDALPWLHDLDALPRFSKRRSGSGE
jgi:hypothetical protein